MCKLMGIISKPAVGVGKGAQPVDNLDGLVWRVSTDLFWGEGEGGKEEGALNLTWGSILTLSLLVGF